MGDAQSDLTAGRWQISLWESPLGRSPIREWLDRLKRARPADYLSVCEYFGSLQTVSSSDSARYSGWFEGNLRELQCGSCRFIYSRAPGKTIVLLTCARAEIGPPPSEEIQLAQSRLRSWMESDTR